MTDAVTLSIELACVVGVLARERTTPQPVRIRLVLETRLEAAATTGQLGRSVDYGTVDAQVRFLATEGRFVLLESLALGVLHLVLLPPAPGEHRVQVDAAEVHVEKPDILPSSVPGVRLRRTSWTDEVLADLPEVHVERRTLGPGEHLSATNGAVWGIVGPEGRHTEVVGPAVVLEVRRLPAGTTVTLPGP